MEKRIVVLVHGWSVHHTNTYGEFGKILENLQGVNGNLVDVKNIWLSKYISFHDEVKIDDLSKAFEFAIRDELENELTAGRKIACITHSTGAPVIRNWVMKFYSQTHNLSNCPLSHLIMLAPANFGSALAQLGKSKISRLKSWFEGVEPGEQILNWLELGSKESWDLNKKWIMESKEWMNKNSIFSFVITGQTIDRKLYDHVNSYTGEIGSDGVVRTCSANLNSTYIRLEQKLTHSGISELVISEYVESISSAFTFAKGKSHSGKEKGIIRSIQSNQDSTLELVFDCLNVNTTQEYVQLSKKFEAHLQKVYDEELIESDLNLLLPDKYFIHDDRSMLIIKVRDDEGHPIHDFDLIFTGPNNDPNLLPHGFLCDRQRNSISNETICFYLNYSSFKGTPEIRHQNKILKSKREGVGELGLRIEPHLQNGFVHYQSALINASSDQIVKFLKPNQTTLLEIVLKRIVHTGVFEITKDKEMREFKKQKPGEII